MVYHGNEQVEEELSTVLHLALHCAASLESVSGSNDEREIVRTKLRVIIGSIGVCVTRRRQNGRALNSRLKTLLLQCEFLQLVKSVLLSLAVDDSVLEDRPHSGMNDSFVRCRWHWCRLRGSSCYASYHTPCVGSNRLCRGIQGSKRRPRDLHREDQSACWWIERTGHYRQLGTRENEREHPHAQQRGVVHGRPIS